MNLMDDRSNSATAFVARETKAKYRLSITNESNGVPAYNISASPIFARFASMPLGGEVTPASAYDAANLLNVGVPCPPLGKKDAY